MRSYEFVSKRTCAVCQSQMTIPIPAHHSSTVRIRSLGSLVEVAGECCSCQVKKEIIFWGIRGWSRCLLSLFSNGLRRIISALFSATKENSSIRFRVEIIDIRLDFYEIFSSLGFRTRDFCIHWPLRYHTWPERILRSKSSE
jgi:hypothetical protein